MVRNQTASNQAIQYLGTGRWPRPMAIEHPARDCTDVGDHSNSKNLDVHPASGTFAPSDRGDPCWKMGVDSAADRSVREDGAT